MGEGLNHEAAIVVARWRSHWSSLLTRPNIVARLPSGQYSKMRELFVIARNEHLQKALVGFLAAAPLGTVVMGGHDLFSTVPPKGSAVVVIANEVSPAACAYLLAGHDLHLLVLAPLPSFKSRAEYERSGAAFAPMTLDRAALLDPLQTLIA